MKFAAVLVLFIWSFAVAQPVAIPSPAVDSSQQIADRIISSKKPVFIDFWAVWCGPCKLLNPIVKELEKEYKGRVEFIKVNVDIHRSLAQYFGVNSIPAVFIVKDKAVVNGLLGLRLKSDYVLALNQALAVPAKSPVPPASTSGKSTPKTTSPPPAQKTVQ